MPSVHIKVLPSLEGTPRAHPDLAGAHQNLKHVMEDVVQDTPSRTFAKGWFWVEFKDV